MTMSMIGKRLGNYDIQSKIGEGGMGMVYLGVHPQIGKRVAAKVLHEELGGKADVVGRFFNEAKAVNDISHPNIVDIIDFGETSFDGHNCKYIIMEFLEGESLAARMKREGVSIRETIHIIAQCASALAASHAKGVVHRDLKPENVYLCSRTGDRNYVKLLDFGIAKLLTDNKSDQNHTRAGMVIGTPTYMSPEQCDGKGLIDGRADIYALGIMLYELFTGKVPFPGDGFGEVLVAHLTREPEVPRTHNPNIPPELEAIVLRCLKKKKEERFQSMNDLMAALLDPGPHYQAWLAGQPAPKAPENLGANGSMMLPSQMMPSSIMPAVGPMMGAMPSGPVAATPFIPMSQPPPSGMVPALQQGWGPPMQPNPMGAVGAGMTPPGMQAPGRTPPGMQAPLPQSSRTPTNMISANMSAPGASSAAISSPSRPSTLQAAAGEATGRRRPRSVLIGFAASMAFGVLSVVTARQLVARPVPQVVPAAPDKALVERVRIVVKTMPSSAEVVPSGDGIEVKGARPFSLAAKKGGGTITLKIKAPGYKEETRTVEPSSDQTLSVDLTKLVEEAPPPIAPVETASTPAGGKKKKGDKADTKKAELDAVAAKDPKPAKTGKGADPGKEAKPAAEPKGTKEAKPAKGPDPIKETKPDKGKDAKPAGDAKGGKKKKKNEDLLPPVF